MDDRARAAAEPLAEATIADRFDLSKSRVLLSGAQAIARLLLSQKARDRRAGLNTGGFVSGYRGSPSRSPPCRRRSAATVPSR